MKQETVFEDKSYKNPQLGKLFEGVQISKGLTLDDVAHYLDTDCATIQLYYEGKKEIPFYHICAISNLLDISPYRILSILNENS